MKISEIRWRLKRGVLFWVYKLKLLKSTEDKIFCISYQRTGTSSVGEFFRMNNFKVIGWHMSHKLRWSELWYEGKYEKIFNSYEFKSSSVFEDSPWFHLDFYKELSERFPKARFILFERDSDKWFSSMLSHSGNRNLGSVYIHAKLYDREDELKSLTGLNPDIRSEENFNLLPLDERHRSKYIAIYEKRNQAVKDFFSNSDRFISLQLEDPDKWKKLADFFGITIDPDLEVHANKTQ